MAHSPAQAAFIALHRAAGRNDLAEIVARFPAELFAEADRMMQAAYVMGLAAALQAQKDVHGTDTGATGTD